MSDEIIMKQYDEAAVNKDAEIDDGSNDKIVKHLALYPKVAIAYVRLALFYQKNGMYEETSAILDKGIELVPDNEILLMMRKNAVIFKSSHPETHV